MLYIPTYVVHSRNWILLFHRIVRTIFRRLLSLGNRFQITALRSTQLMSFETHLFMPELLNVSKCYLSACLTRVVFNFTSNYLFMSWDTGLIFTNLFSAGISIGYSIFSTKTYEVVRVGLPLLWTDIFFKKNSTECFPAVKIIKMWKLFAIHIF